jgi:group I intron endonuclease
LIVQSGVYEIVNTVTGRRYVGSAINFARRWRQHRHDLRNNKHKNGRLQNSWNKHGEAAFAFQKILVCSAADCVLYEQIAIDALSPELNLNPRAASRLGAVASEAARRKMRDAKVGRPGPWAGRTLSPEHREKLSQAKRGRKPPNFGVPCSEEQKNKIRAKLTKSKDPTRPRTYREVVDVRTGEKYRSIAEAARRVGMTAVALGFQLRGRSTNVTSLRYADGYLC